MSCEYPFITQLPVFW